MYQNILFGYKMFHVKQMLTDDVVLRIGAFVRMFHVEHHEERTRFVPTSKTRLSESGIRRAGRQLKVSEREIRFESSCPSHSTTVPLGFRLLDAQSRNAASIAMARAVTKSNAA
jgi:hypothetical protein